MPKGCILIAALDGETGIAADLTAMILTYNEAANISRTMDALAWVKEILVIDSGSTDETLDIVARYSNARVVTRSFDSFAEQCNFGLTAVRTGWVLSLDADYELTPAIATEIRTLIPTPEVSGYRASFIYRVYGRALSATLYPPRTVLYRTSRGHYRNEGHSHRVVVRGVVRALTGAIFHDDRKSLTRWVTSQYSYSRREAEYLLTTPRSQLNYIDRLRLTGWLAPFLVFFYTLLWNRCFLDGWAGWLYVLQRTFAEIIVAIQLVDLRLRPRPSES